MFFKSYQHLFAHSFSYYNKKERSKKSSKIDSYKEIIEDLLLNKKEMKQIFYYKTHLYRYLKREHGLKCSRSNFNSFILKNKQYANYFKVKENNKAVKTETPFGKQAQFDWKERLKIDLSDGTKITINVASLVLSASRMKIWSIYPSMNQDYLFDFMANALDRLGGVPKEIIIDNAKTMMDQPRTKYKKGKVNIKFDQMAKDFGFKIVPCAAGRAKTKAYVKKIVM